MYMYINMCIYISYLYMYSDIYIQISIIFIGGVTAETVKAQLGDLKV